MKVIVTSGHPLSGFEQVAQNLHTAGVKEALPSRNEGLSPLELQGKIVAAHSSQLGADSPVTQLQPGKIWQNLAVDLFMGNQETDIWGWADSRTVHLLDFWLEFDPHIFFILVYASPQQTVGKMLRNSTDPEKDLHAVITSWVAINSQLLRFYNRHQNRCLLINAAAASGNAVTLIQKTATKCTAAFTVDCCIAAPEQSTDDALVSLLAQPFIEANEEIRSLYLELESSSDLNLSLIATTKHTPLDAWQDYRGLLAQHNAECLENTHLIAQLTQDNAKLAQQIKDVQQECGQVSRENEAVATLADQFKTQLATERRESEELKATVEKLTSNHDAVMHENELLLQQLHQVQEELEQIFIQKNDLSKDLDDQRRNAGDIQRQVATLEKEKASHSSACDALKNEVAELKRTIDQLTTSRDEQSQRLIDYKNQLERLTEARDKQMSQDKARVDELSQENELLLLQLHQVQEELEHYYLLYTEKHKTAQPAEKLLIDLRQEFEGDNWYYPERDGRWAGPNTVSTIKMPQLTPGIYRLELTLVDGMEYSIVKNMIVRFNGTVLETKLQGRTTGFFAKRHHYPLVLSATIEIPAHQEHHTDSIQLEFHKLISPSERGSDDQRMLAVRIRSLCMLRED